jgi:hypothetical protein
LGNEPPRKLTITIGETVDLQAVQKGKVGRRTGRRLAGEATGRALGELFKY